MPWNGGCPGQRSHCDDSSCRTVAHGTSSDARANGSCDDTKRFQQRRLKPSRCDRFEDGRRSSATKCQWDLKERRVPPSPSGNEECPQNSHLGVMPTRVRFDASFQSASITGGKKHVTVRALVPTRRWQDNATMTRLQSNVLRAGIGTRGPRHGAHDSRMRRARAQQATPHVHVHVRRVVSLCVCSVVSFGIFTYRHGTGTGNRYGTGTGVTGNGTGTGNRYGTGTGTGAGTGAGTTHKS